MPISSQFTQNDEGLYVLKQNSAYYVGLYPYYDSNIFLLTSFLSHFMFLFKNFASISKVLLISIYI